MIEALFRTYNRYDTFGEKFANFNEFYNIYERTEQLWIEDYHLAKHRQDVKRLDGK